MSELRADIKQAINGFAMGKPLEQSRQLLNALGYQSDNTETIAPNNWAGFKALFVDGSRQFNEGNARVAEWQTVDLIFQLGEDDLKQQNSLFSGGRFDNKAIYSYAFFCIALTGESYSRTDLARITREINKLFDMPAMLLFRYGDSLTIAAIDRRLHKRDESRDVLEKKVTFIKDINVAEPIRAHIEILHDLALPSLVQRYKVDTFVALHNAWRAVLDISALNKRFYREIADWYFWAVKEVQFPLPPTNKLAADPTNNSICVIRLLTRLIFVWFLKEKGLVPECLFDEKELARILVGAPPCGCPPLGADADKGDHMGSPLQGASSTYYRAILQNLFFATLNAEMNRDIPGNRRFVQAETGDINKQKTEYGIKNIFRYADLFTITKEEAVRLFDDIPFLNGGLFDCLDKEDDNGKVIYLDGFTRNTKLQPVVPDYLFFSDYQTIDLSSDYGDKKRAQENVRGFIRILRDYKFTVAENTPIEEEVALDPELLGNVFENLLASYNPETGVTARKLTGSFYTPRMIVNYMVDGALQAYLEGKLLEANPPQPPFQKGGSLESPTLKGDYELKSPFAKGDLGGFGSRLNSLIAWNDLPNPFSPEETAILIEAIHTLKTLDPAVGSGAFPMGLLHKMVHILHKLDPDNARWKQVQIDKAEQISDAGIRRDSIQLIEDVFDPSSKQADYGRKLFLIQNCIYGVDIQPIAVQIAKLRFFISLVVDQKVNDTKKNRGVLALPNLETRFVAANTLLGIDKPPMDNLFMGQIRGMEAELRRVRSRHFDARTRQEKLMCMADDKRIRGEIALFLEQDNYPHDKAVLLSDWNPYDQSKSADFFDAEWMFGIVDGFDISIGNPPFVRADAGEEHLLLRKRILESKQYVTLWEKWDLFVPFIELGFKVLKPNGVTTLIVSDGYCHAKYAQKSQEWFLRNALVKKLDFLGNLNVFEAAVHNVIYLYQNTDGTTNRPERRLHEEEFGNVRLLQTDEQQKLTSRAFFPGEEQAAIFDVPTVPLSDICYISVGMVVHADEKMAKGTLKGTFELSDLVSEHQDALHPKAFVEGKHLDRWLPARQRWLEWGTDRAPGQFRRTTFSELYEVPEKLISVDMSAGVAQLRVAYDNGRLYHNHSAWSFVPWNSLAKVRNNSLKKVARYLGEKPSRPDLPQREALEKTSRRFAVKYLLAVMNSAFAKNFLRANRRSNIHLYPDDWKQLPIPDVTAEKQAPVVALVEQILAAKKSPPAPLSQRGGQPDISTLEAEIDRLVYALYNLTDDETIVVEGGK